MDFMAIVSRGVYPTPTPTGALRAALAVSYGFLNTTLQAAPTWTIKAWNSIGGEIDTRIKQIIETEIGS